MLQTYGVTHKTVPKFGTLGLNYDFGIAKKLVQAPGFFDSFRVAT